MKRTELIGLLACSLLLLLLAKLWGQSSPVAPVEKPHAWEYRVVLLSELQNVSDGNQDGNNDTGEVAMARHLNQKINELGKERWEFVLEHTGWLHYWLFRRPINP